MTIFRPLPIALALLLALPLGTGWGNMAEPPQPYTLRPGSVAGEAMGGLRDVFIEHETLRIDLRPLKKGRAVLVEAAYRVRNHGAARVVDLLFVADGLARGAATVTVDGRPVASRPGAAATLPPSWRPPATTPWVSVDTTSATLPYEPRRAGTLSFRVRLPAGRHEIRVRYPADATAYSVNDLTPVWQLGYVLAPAREWGGFGGLEVRVEVPRGWQVLTEPALRQEGGALVGAWNGIPADALAISAQQPEPPSGPWYLLWGVLTAAGLAGIGWIGRRVGGALGRRGRSGWWALPVSIALSLAWTVASAFAYGAVPSLVRWQAGPFADGYAYRAMSYGSSILLLLLFPVMLLAGVVVAQVCAVISRRGAVRE